MKKFIYVLIIFALASLSIQGQYVDNVSKRGTTAGQFLKVGQGARATGMGSAFVGVADDASSIFWNVAGIARSKQNSFVFDHTTWIADLKYNYVAGSVNLGEFGTIGVSFIGSDYGDMKVTTIEEPNGTGEIFTVNDMAISIAWAINLTEDFSIGFNPKYISQSIWNASGAAFAFDMGILYNTPFEGFTLGMSITNLGTKLQLQGNSNVVLYDQDPSTIGDNPRIPAELSTTPWTLPLTFAIGVSYQVLETNMHKLVVDVDALHPNDDYESLNVGGEYVFNDLLSLRGGYRSLFLDGSERTFAFGAGIKQRVIGNLGLRVDYAYQDFGRLTAIHKLSVGIDF